MKSEFATNSVKIMGAFFALSAVLFIQAVPLTAQQIPASELPPPGSDTGLDGKYDPQNALG